MLVLAVDVGIATCGYVICEVCGRQIKLIKENEIKPKTSRKVPEKLYEIFKSLEKEVKSYNLDAITTETLYAHHRHPTTLGVLAQVKGVVGLLAQMYNIPCQDFSTTRARKSFMGKGNVDSIRVKKMAENLCQAKFKSVHTADAYSLVSAFAHEEAVKNLKKRIKP